MLVLKIQNVVLGCKDAFVNKEKKKKGKKKNK